METAKLKKFAQFARRSLLEQVTAKLKLVLADESPARRERPQAIKKLEEAVTDQGKEQVIERVAYIWFNRFCALRFMDVNRYNRIGIVSPAEGQFQPEILADAKMGHIDEEMVSESTRQKIFTLLDGKTPSQDPQGEAYRLLVVAACNYWYSAMPFLFERIDDYTELLMPDDLLSGNSILAYTREAMTPDACEDVEVIGWLYQFYISEKKDQVFADLKKNKKVTPENIPAATQLFTPHWIVRYLVENSLGRLWMLNRPDSGLVEQMDYYIKPEEPETDFLRINSPEEIKICDPACGSGHMLTYAFDLLYAIYEEEGYEPADIPAKILTHNLYGIEIDERAGELAAFALTMKARAKQRRFFRKPVEPNVVVLENVTFTETEMQDVAALVGKGHFTDELRETLAQFEQAKNFGSLIMPKLPEPAQTLRVVEAGDFRDDLLLKELQTRLAAVLRMTEVLSHRYHVVVANPPYAGTGSVNLALNSFAKSNYPNSKADLFSMFIERNLKFVEIDGYSALVTMQSWLFLTAYERLRGFLLHKSTICSLVQIGYNSFPELNSKVAQAAAFVLKNGRSSISGEYLNLNDAPQASNKENVFRQYKDKNRKYVSHQDTFAKLPGKPIAYWISDEAGRAFVENPSVGDLADVKNGMSTTDNERFTRQWFEVSDERLERQSKSGVKARESRKKWFPYNKGGLFRRWFGNHGTVVNWQCDGRDIKKAAEGASGGRIVSEEFFFKPSLSWSKVSTGKFAVRYYDPGGIFDVAGPSIFAEQETQLIIAAQLNGKTSFPFIEQLSPTINYEGGQVQSIPMKTDLLRSHTIVTNGKTLIALARADWDSYETSWDFTTLPLLLPDHRGETLETSYASLHAHWRDMTKEMRRLEEENNRIFIDAYRLQDELSPEVPIEEITLTCNPAYRYGVKGSAEDRETRLLADTMAELISYAVGCMFGRYALDKPGLIMGNQGETIEDYLKRVPEPSFPADDDNVIPMLDGDWFTDDITERFREFLRIAFGEEHYEENLRFVEQALGKDIRKYVLKDFYNDHVRRYKKRPIYWLFSSPKGSFNALIYMHRYQPHTVGTVLEYLRDFKDEKLQARKNHLEAVSISAGASQGDKTKALKEIEKINKILAELDDYERDVLYPLATEQVEIDLDDGVKANYPKFGDALKKIPGLS